MRYGCSQDAGGASRGIAKRPPGSNRSRRSENDHHALWSIAALVAISYLCFDNVFHEVDVVLSSYPRRWTDVAIFCILLYTWRNIDLTSARLTLQSSNLPSLKPFSVPMSFAKPNLVLERPPSSSSPLSNKLSQLLAKPPFLSCVTPVNLRIRSRMNTLVSASICQM
jgi:hypothetical protein